MNAAVIESLSKTLSELEADVPVLRGSMGADGRGVLALTSILNMP